MTDNSFDRIPLTVTDEVRKYWREISHWALFFAILLFIAASFTGLFTLSFVTGRDRLPAVLTGILITSLSFLPGFLYFRFYSLMKAYLREENEEDLEKAFASLKWFYIFSAVATIFIIIFWILVLNPGQSEMEYE